MTTILVTFLLGIIIFGIYFLIRNEQVLDFKLDIFDLCDKRLTEYVKSDSFNQEKYTEYKTKLFFIRNRYTHEEMLFSFKPLRLDKWFTEEDIKLLTEAYK